MRNLGYRVYHEKFGCLLFQRPSTDFDAFRDGTPGLYSLDCIPGDGTVTADDGPVVGIDPGVKKPIQADNGLFEVKVGSAASLLVLLRPSWCGCVLFETEPICLQTKDTGVRPWSAATPGERAEMATHTPRSCPVNCVRLPGRSQPCESPSWRCCHACSELDGVLCNSWRHHTVLWLEDVEVDALHCFSPTSELVRHAGEQVRAGQANYHRVRCQLLRAEVCHWREWDRSVSFAATEVCSMPSCCPHQRVQHIKEE